MNFLSIVGSV
jgi:hypothetical protein